MGWEPEHQQGRVQGLLAWAGLAKTEQIKQRFKFCKNVTSIQTPQAGPLRLQIASHQASKLGRIFKAGLLVHSLRLPNENNESQKRQVTCQRPNSQKARSLGHLLCHRPTGSCFFFSLLVFPFRDAFKVFPHGSCVCILSKDSA